MGLIVFLLIGLVAGALARMLVPGPDGMGILGTMVLGVIGSFIGGFLMALVTDASAFDLHATGLIGSTIGAIVALMLYKASRRTRVRV